MTLNFPKPAFSGQTYQIGESPYYIFNGNYWEIDKSYVVNGSSGTSGTSGIGSSGTAGTSGTSGTSGIGSSGTAGTSGSSGSNGTSGTSGTSGGTGSSGTSGTNGSSGSSGTSGLLTLTGTTAGGIITYNGSGTNATVQSGVTYSGTTLTVSGSLIVSGSTNSVNNRLTTLESSIITGSPNYTQVLGNRRTSITTTGVSIISGSITTTGNPVQIMVTGDANPVNVSSWTRLQIYRNETAIGNIVQVENSSNLNVPYCVNVIDTASAGTYTYSMRTVSGISGLFDFGESMGPTLTIVELNTNTNLPSTNNTFTGTNRFNGQVTLGGAGGDEGGEIQLATAQTNTTLTGSVVSVDIYQDRLRIFEAGGNARGVYIDLSKTPAGNAGELMWKTSGMVGAGTFVTLDNLKCAVTTSGQRGLSIGAVSTTFDADASGWYTVSGGSGGATSNNLTYTTTASNSFANWNFATHGDMVQVNLRDKTNNRFYRITMMIGTGYISNFISIERLF